MTLNNEKFRLILKYFLRIDLIIMTYGLFVFPLSFIDQSYIIKYVENVNMPYYFFNYYYTLFKCLFGLIYMIKWMFNYYTHKNKNNPLIWTIITTLIIIPSFFKVGDIINKWLEIDFGFIILFVIIGFTYWIRFIFCSWNALNLKRIIYIMVFILSIIISYYIWVYSVHYA